MPKVGCTKCGKNNPGLSRWCPGCGEEIRPLLLTNRPDNNAPLACSNCGTLNSGSDENCVICGSPLPRSKPFSIGENPGNIRGGRITLDPKELEGGEASTPSPGPNQPGGRLSRLAQARGKLEPEKKNPTIGASDWLDSLRTDTPASPNNASTPGGNSNSNERPDPATMPGVPPPLGEVQTPPREFEYPKSDEFAWPSDVTASQASAPSNLEEPVISPPVDNPDTYFNPALGDLPDDTTLPDWLKNLKAKIDPTSNQSRPAASQTSDSGLESPEFIGNMPQWLRDFAAASAAFPDEKDNVKLEAAKSPSRLEEISEPPEDEAELPDWLRSAKVDSFIEQEAPQKDILDWLKGPSQMVSDMPERPTFGDVDVEERLNFAFDEPSNSSTPPPRVDTTRLDDAPAAPNRPQSGLTNILGFSPYGDNANQSISSRWQEKTPESLSGSVEAATEFLPIPDFMGESSFSEEPGNVDALEPTALDSILPFWLNGLKPPALDGSSYAYHDQVAAEGGAIAASPSNLAPWLEGLQLPALEASAATPSNPDQPLNDLPAIDTSGDSQDSPGTGSTGSQFPTGNPRIARERGTRPFSVGAMFHQTDYLSERFIGEGVPQSYPEEEHYSPASSGEATFPAFTLPDESAETVDETDSGDTATIPGAASPEADFNLSEAVTWPTFETPDEAAAPSAFELPQLAPELLEAVAGADKESYEWPVTDDEALSNLLASLPALPDLPFEADVLPAGDETQVDTQYQNQGKTDTGSGYGVAETVDEPQVVDDYKNTQAATGLEGAEKNTCTDAGSVSADAVTGYESSDDTTTEFQDYYADDDTGYGVAAPTETTTRDATEAVEAAGEDAPVAIGANSGEDEETDSSQTGPALPEPVKLTSTVEPEESPSLSSLDDGKPSTFKLPDFLANLDNPTASATQSEPEKPTWQRLFTPDKPTESTDTAPGSDEAATSDATANEPEINLPAFLRDGDFASEAPVSSPAVTSEESTATAPAPETPAQESSKSEWAKPWEDAAVETPAQTDQTPAAATPVSVESAAAEGERDDDIPSWLKSLSAGTSPEVTAPRPAASGYTEMNAGYNSAEVAGKPQAPLPDWLRDDSEAAPGSSAIATTESVQKEVQPKGPTAETRELPDWLRESAVEPASAVIPNFPMPTDLPDWLREPEAPALTFGADDYTGPGLARDPNAGPPVDYSTLLEEVPGQFSGSNFFNDMEGPAWLRQANQPKPPEQATGAPTPAVTTAEHSMPNWLRTVAPPPNAEPAAPTNGQETAPYPANEVAVVEPPTAQAGHDSEEDLPSVYLPPQLASAAVLTALLTPPTTPMVPAATGVEKRPLGLLQGNIVRYILYILLIAVALIGLLQPLPVGNLPVVANVQTFYDQIDRLPANSKVLIAFDWEADRYGEMGPLSSSVVQHIMAKRARLVTLSLTPQGPALAARITDELATNANYGNSSFYKYGSTYLNLGWRSGQEAALRSLFDAMGDLTDYKNGQRASGLAATSGINSLNDFDLIVVLAGDEGSVRAWVEQVGVQPGARLILGVPLAVEPIARPYAQGLSTANLTRLTGETQPRAPALLAGLNQTAQYDQLLQDKLKLKTDPTVSLEGRLSAQSLAALLLVVVIIVGNIVYLARRRR